MSEWHRVAGADEVPDGAVVPVVAGGRRIALVRVAERYCALDGTCPHAGGPLGEGSIDNGMLVCPWHGREFDLATGACEGYPGVAAYPVQVRADGIYVEA